MGSRTYLPTLKLILDTMCKYIVRYRDQILKVVGEDNATALDALVTACNVWNAIADAFIPDGS
jgi:hypothetical protein